MQNEWLDRRLRRQYEGLGTVTIADGPAGGDAFTVQGPVFTWGCDDPITWGSPPVADDLDITITVGAPQWDGTTVGDSAVHWCCVTGADRGVVPSVLDVYRATTLDMNGEEVK
jgi:hypothetical protein